jgi:RNA polymerase sigma-54 factor
VLGDEEHAQVGRATVQDRLRQVVEAENKEQPLSDEDIAKQLKSEGFDVARRTVAKYRRELKIPSSWRRRRY